MVSTPSSSELLQLPLEIMYHVLSLLPPNSLAEICKGDVQLSRICNSQDFWNFKHQESFGNVPKLQPKNPLYYYPPPSFEYYLVYLKQLGAQINELSKGCDLQIKNLLMSAVHPDNEPKVEVILKLISDELTLDVEYCFREEDLSVSDCFDVFNARLTYSMKGGRPFRGMPPRREDVQMFLQKRLISSGSDPERRLNLDLTSDIFKRLTISKFGRDPYRALSRAIFDLLLNCLSDIFILHNEYERVQSLLTKNLEIGYGRKGISLNYHLMKMRKKLKSELNVQ